MQLIPSALSANIDGNFHTSFFAVFAFSAAKKTRTAKNAENTMKMRY